MQDEAQDATQDAAHFAGDEKRGATPYMNKKSFLLGLLASALFSTTFTLNRSMHLGGGSFFWTASLRFLVMLPIMFVLVYLKGDLKKTHAEIARHAPQWFLWSIVGFGVFYFFLSWGSDFGSSWLVVGTWQLTIVMGILLTPLFHRAIPRRNLFIAIIIVIGVFILEYQNASQVTPKEALMHVGTIGIAAIAYPLGNRKLMALDHNLTTIERVYAMTLCSLPVWILVSIAGYLDVGWPSTSQLIQGALVGIFSGVLATILFFKATDMVKFDPKALAITESTVAGEVVFTLIFGILLLGDPLPSTMGFVGLAIIILGMAFNR